MRTENDMMPIEVRARDLTPGDLVNGAELVEGMEALGIRVDSHGRLAATLLSLCVDRVDRYTDSRVTIVTRLHGNWTVPSDLPVTVQPVICADCGSVPTDCECVDAECPHCGVELDGHEVVELDAKSCFNCNDKET